MISYLCFFRFIQLPRPEVSGRPGTTAFFIPSPSPILYMGTGGGKGRIGDIEHATCSMQRLPKS